MVSRVLLILYFLQLGFVWGFGHLLIDLALDAIAVKQYEPYERHFEKLRPKWRSDELVGLTNVEIRNQYGHPSKIFKQIKFRLMPNCDEEWRYSGKDKPTFVGFKQGKCAAVIRGYPHMIFFESDMTLNILGNLLVELRNKMYLPKK